MQDKETCGFISQLGEPQCFTSQRREAICHWPVGFMMSVLLSFAHTADELICYCTKAVLRQGIVNSIVGLRPGTKV